VLGWNRDRCLTLVCREHGAEIHAFNFDGTHMRLGKVDLDVEVPGWSRRVVAINLRAGQHVAFVKDGTVWVQRIGEEGLTEPWALGRHEGTGHAVAVDPEGRLIATSNTEGEIKIWDLASASSVAVVQGPEDIDRIGFFGSEPHLAVCTVTGNSERIWVFSFTDGEQQLLRTIDSGQTFDIGIRQQWGWDEEGRRYARNSPDQATRLWSMAAPADAEPLSLRRGEIGMDWWHSFHPNGQWLATADGSGLMVWPLGHAYASVIPAHQKPVWKVAFGPRGRWLASGCRDGIVRLLPLEGDVPTAGWVVARQPTAILALTASPDGSTILAGGENWGAQVIPREGTPPVPLGDLSAGCGLDYSSDGRLAAVAGRTDDDRYVLQVFATDTLEPVVSLEPEDRVLYVAPHFLDDGRIMYSRESGLYVYDPGSETSERVFEGICYDFAVSDNGQRVALVDLSSLTYNPSARVIVLDLAAGITTHLVSHGSEVWSIAMNGAGTVVATGDRDGVLRVGPADGFEPHLLLGHDGRIWDVDIDPAGRWIATGGDDTTVRIWPMPDLAEPPLHRLPHDEAVAKLKRLTNLRVVRDEDSAAAWTLTHDPFPGWETVPSW
jgi:WD40 repeat protein